jgi:hypothetical protein
MLASTLEMSSDVDGHSMTAELVLRHLKSMITKQPSTIYMVQLHIDLTTTGHHFKEFFFF